MICRETTEKTMDIIVEYSETNLQQFTGGGAYNGKESPVASSKNKNGSCRVEPSRRPSPFGPAIALLSENHQLPQVGERTSVADALRVMFDHRFSQLAVMDSASCIRGIFSFRTLSARVLDLQDANIDLAA